MRSLERISSVIYGVMHCRGFGLVLLVALCVQLLLGGDAQSQGKDKDSDSHGSKEQCQFNNIEDMKQQVNSKAMEYARSKGQSRREYDMDGNNRLDALEGKYYAAQGQLGSYMCSEFSAVLACILQELFNCSSEQVRVVEGNNHSINQLNRNMFRNPPAQGDAKGWFNFEPQRFFEGGNAGANNGVGYGLKVYDKPQPYRSGVNNTIYDELGCKSGPGYNEGGGAAGLFGGEGGSKFLSGMIASMMQRMNQNRNQTPTPTPEASPTSDPFAPKPTSTPDPDDIPLSPTPAPRALSTPVQPKALQAKPLNGDSGADFFDNKGDSNSFFQESTGGNSADIEKSGGAETSKDSRGTSILGPPTPLFP
jgi:hypothetical protein